MVNDKFSFSRMLQYGKTNNYIFKNIVIYISIIPIYTIIVSLLNFFFKDNTQDNVDMSNNIAINYDYFISIIFIIIMIVKQFTKSRNTIEMMIPASNSEKFVFKVIVSLFVIPISFCCVVFITKSFLSLFSLPMLASNFPDHIPALIGVIMFGYVLLSIFFFFSSLLKRFAIVSSLVVIYLLVTIFSEVDSLDIRMTFTHLMLLAIILVILSSSWLVFKRINCDK